MAAVNDLLSGMGALWVVIAGVVAIAGACWLAVRQDRKRRAAAPARPRIEGTCFYLHDQSVMDLYFQGGNKALEQHVEETIRNLREGNVAGKGPGFEAGLGRTAEVARTVKYVVEEKPITVIRGIMQDLADGNNLVDVDLINRLIEPGTGLEHALRAARGRRWSGRRRVRLRDLDAFVWVRGRFRETAKTAETITFSAPYGDPADPAGEPHVSVTCVLQQVRNDVPADPFPARCLGKVQAWDPSRRELVINTIAIFK